MKTEKQTRYWLMKHAKSIGAEKDLQDLFNKWDRAIMLAPNSEKEDMSKLAILQVQSLLDIRAEDGLTINGKVIIPAMGEKNG